MKNLYLPIIFLMLCCATFAQNPLLESEGAVKISNTSLTDNYIIKYNSEDLKEE